MWLTMLANLPVFALAGVVVTNLQFPDRSVYTIIYVWTLCEERSTIIYHVLFLVLAPTDKSEHLRLHLWGPSIPPRLVTQIQSGELIDMVDLLKDHLAPTSTDRTSKP